MHDVKILSKEEIANNVFKFIIEKPNGYTVKPGQSTTIKLGEQEGSFTPVSSSEDEYLEFNIKIYPEHQGLTLRLSKLDKGDIISLSDPFGKSIEKKDILYISGGTGITPFIAHLKNSEKPNSVLISGYSLRKDIFYENYINSSVKEWVVMLSNEDIDEYKHGFIDKKVIKETIDSNKEFEFKEVYICGPPKFEEVMKGIVSELGLKPVMMY